MDLFAIFKKKKDESERDKAQGIGKSEELSQLDRLIDDIFELDEQRYAQEKKAV
jgi:hypothetical protein